MRILLFLPLESRTNAQATEAGGCCVGDWMGRTIPSFRLALADEEADWKNYREYLGKKERKAFDEMFAITRLYISACSGAVKPVRIYPIFISILLHHYSDLVKIAARLGRLTE